MSPVSKMTHPLTHEHGLCSNWTAHKPLYSLIDKAFWCVSLCLQVTCGPVTVHQLPVPINEYCIPAVVRRCTGDWSTRLIVHAFRPSSQCHTVHSRIPTMTIVISTTCISLGLNEARYKVVKQHNVRNVMDANINLCIKIFTWIFQKLAINFSQVTTQ